QGPLTAPASYSCIRRDASALYDEDGLLNMNLGGFPTYASFTRPMHPTRPTRRLRPMYPVEESEIMLAAFQSPNFTPDHTNVTIATGVACSLFFNTNHNPTSFGIANPPLPSGLSIDTTNGN